MFGAAVELAVAAPDSGHAVCPRTLAKEFAELAVNATVAVRARPLWVTVTVGAGTVVPVIAEACPVKKFVATVFAWVVVWVIRAGDTAASAAASAAAFSRCSFCVAAA